jgi:hypothetical protein
MPYIPQARRKGLQRLTMPAESAGELNFQITKLLDRYLLKSGLSYTNINAAIGVLECAKLELYRRVAEPYEDQKAAENGDVYTCLKKLT